MRRILIASHGRLSEGIIDSVKMLIGEYPNVEYFFIKPGDSMDIIDERIQQFVNGGGTADELIVVSDIWGGSISNACIEYARKEKIHLLCGFNLPMILELLLSPDDMVSEELISNTLERGKSGIMDINKLLKSKEII